jgi:pimeloyl-ACP methyl ester carboxylesterase
VPTADRTHWRRGSTGTGRWPTTPTATPPRKAITTPILYVRGDADGRSPRPYLAGMRAAGATDVRSVTIAGCGECLPLEQPDAFVDVIRTFTTSLP